MTVFLKDSMGNDLAIVDAARVSFNAESSYLPDGTLSARDKGLIHFLMREKHLSPFEHVVFKFRVETPIFVARQWMRHRNSYNEESGRYTELVDGFYVPELEDIRVQKGKAGAYTFESADYATAIQAQTAMRHSMNLSLATYKTLLKQGVAREVARQVLPVAMMTKFIWTVNLRSLFNFLSLRNESHAQLEIQKEATQVEDFIKPIVPIAYSAWVEYGRKGM